MSRTPFDRHASVVAAAVLAPVLAAEAVALIVDSRVFAVAGIVGLAVGVAATWPWLARRRRLASIARTLEDMAVSVEPASDGASDPVQRIERAIARLRQPRSPDAGGIDMAIGAALPIFDSVPDPLLLLSSGRSVIAANRAARSLLGEGIGGRHLAEVLRHPEVLEAVGQTVADGEGRSVEIEFPSPVERHFAVRIEPVVAGRPRPGDRPGHVLALLHDTTQLSRLERMRADFVANASHEIRTPLATLAGFIETLRGPAKDDAEARQRFLGIMHDQANRMTRLVGDLLSLSRIELREHTPPTARVDLGSVLRGVKEGLDPAAERRGIRIDLAIPDDLPPAVGDADELAQVFQNLLDNALKYARSDSPVVVEASLTDRPPPAYPRPGTAAIVVRVIDRGEGIPAEHLSRLTERFYRVDPARSRALGGTGLGLAIVKHIVNRHRGALTVDSELGVGTVFSVVLPPHPDQLRPAGR
jgi:two-component system phosphate regulon sensor histidine kinase PhoR